MYPKINNFGTEVKCDKTLQRRPSETMIPWAVNLGESILRGIRDSAEKIKSSIKAKIHLTDYGFMCSQNTSLPLLLTLIPMGKLALK